MDRYYVSSVLFLSLFYLPLDPSCRVFFYKQGLLAIRGHIPGLFVVVIGSVFVRLQEYVILHQGSTGHSVSNSSTRLATSSNFPSVYHRLIKNSHWKEYVKKVRKYFHTSLALNTLKIPFTLSAIYPSSKLQSTCFHNKALILLFFVLRYRQIDTYTDHYLAFCILKLSDV